MLRVTLHWNVPECDVSTLYNTSQGLYLGHTVKFINSFIQAAPSRILCLCWSWGPKVEAGGRNTESANGLSCASSTGILLHTSL
jgi:hypothetical protein